MAVRNWPDPAEERAAIERERARRSRVTSYQQTATAAQAQRISAIAAAYPNMSPGTAGPLGLAGVSPDDPVVAQAATAEAKKNKRKRGIFGAIGDLAGGAVGWGVDALGEVGELASDIAKPVARTGLSGLMAPFEAGTGVIRNVAAAGGAIAAGAVSGAATGAGVGLFAGGIGAVPGAIGGAVAGGVLGGVAQARGIEVEGEFVNPLSQTTLGQDLFGGKDIGQGYLPGGTAHAAQAESARKAASVRGHALTPGRLLAASVTPEDHWSYTLLSGAIDLSNAWKLDPANLAGAAAGRKLAQAKKFTGVARADDAVRAGGGLVDHGNRPGVIFENAQRWLTADKRGQGFVEWVRQTDDFETIRKALPGIAPETALDLADAKTADDVIAQLLPRVEGETPRGLGLERALEEKPYASTRRAEKVRWAGMTIGRKFQGSRLLADLPGKELNLFDHTEAVDWFSAFQRNANLPKETVARNTRQLAENLRDGDYKAALRTVTEDFVAGPDGVLAQSGLDLDLGKQMSKLYLSAIDDVERRAFFEQGYGTRVSHADIGGETFDLAAPSILTAEAGTVLKVDRSDIRAIRQTTGKFAPLYKHPVAGELARQSAAVGDFLTSQVWKPFALLRGAYTVRVIAEEQIRMANAGVDSLFAHPISYLAWMAADDGKLGKVLDKFGVTVRRGDVDVLGQAFTEAPASVEKALRGHANDFAAALGRKSMQEHWMVGSVRQQGTRVWNRGEAHHVDALVDRLATMHNDPILRRTANGGVLDEDPQTFRTGPAAVRHWLAEGDGVEIRRTIGSLKTPMDVDDMLTRAHTLVDDVVGAEARAGAQMTVPGGRGVGTPVRSSGDPRLRRAIATGEIDGVPMYLDNGAVNPAFKTKVGEIVDEGAGPFAVTGSAYDPASLKDRWDDGVEKAFNFFMGNRTANLSRSPHFRQYYWKEAEQLAFTLKAEDQAKLLASMDAAELPEAMKAGIRKAAGRGTGDLTLEQVDTLLKGRALDATRELLYDVSKRGQLSDVLRIIYPFAESQKEVMTTWARLATKNPAIPRRAHQIIEGARGAGIFYKDPQTGEEMFSYPGSRIITEKLFGMPIPLGNRVEGLSMFGSGLMPGAGPVVQLSARWFLPDKPQFDQLREMIDPFGESAEGGILEQFGPGWAKALLSGFNMDDSDAAFGNDMFDVYSVGLSSGMYRNDTPEDIRDGLENAKQKARWLHIIRGGAMMLGAPSPPRPEFYAQDKDGRWTMMDALVKEYRKIQDEDPENSSALFLEKFGPAVFALVQPSTYTGGRVLPEATTTAGTWARTHQGLSEKYPAIYGLFAPKDPDAPFDIQVWARQKREEERIPLDPEQRAKWTNDRLAGSIYYNIKGRFGPFPNKMQKQYLSGLREKLKTDYPGFEENLGLPEKYKAEDRIKELEQAVKDESLADNPVTEPTKIYLAIRNRLNEAVQEAGIAQSVAKAKSTAPMRAYLRSLAERLVTQHPEFGDVWDRVFEPELIDDTATPEEVPAIA